MDCKPSVKII